MNLFTKLEEALASVTPLIVNIQTYTSKKEREMAGTLKILSLPILLFYIDMKATMKDIFQQLLSHDEEVFKLFHVCIIIIIIRNILVVFQTAQSAQSVNGTSLTVM